MGLDRRGFISFLVGGTAGILCTPMVWKGLDDVSIWSQNWPWIPRLKYGAKAQVPSLCKLSSDVYGIQVNTVAGNPVSAQGNVEHPLSQGGIDALGAASVQLLYSPSRVRGPLKRTGDKYVSITWDEAKKILLERLQQAGKDVAVISGDESGSATEVLTGFVSQLGSDKNFLMPGEAAPAALGWNDVLSGTGQVGYDLENSDFVLMLGADVLGAWGTTLRNAKAFGNRGKSCSYAYAGPVQMGTASVCEQWIPCKPGKESVLALGLAYYILQSTGVDAGFAGYAQFKKFVTTNYTPQKVEAITGVAADQIKALAQKLMQSKKPLVLTGSDFGQGLGAFDFAAGMSLNMLLGRINRKGGVQALPQLRPVVKGAPFQEKLLGNDLTGYLRAVADGKTKAAKVLMVYEANPAYALPESDKMNKAMRESFVVSFTPFLDETAGLADLVLPNSYFLERMDDAYTPYGSGQANYSIALPVIEPLFDTKATPDFILELAADLDIDLGFSNFEEILKAKSNILGADWDGLASGSAWISSSKLMQLSLGFKAFPKNFGLETVQDECLPLAASQLVNVGSSKMATPPFNLLSIPADQLQGKDFFVHINSATAKNLKLKPGHKVKLSTDIGECEAKVHIYEGVMTDVVWAPLGFGHQAWDDFSQGKGDNLYKVIKLAPSQLGASVFNAPQVKISKA